MYFMRLPLPLKDNKSVQSKDDGRFENEWEGEAKQAALNAVDNGDGIKVIFWNEISHDSHTSDSQEKIFDEFGIGYYWKLYDLDGWAKVGQWLYKSSTGDPRVYDTRKPLGRWVPYQNVVNKLFYCGPTPMEWDNSWGTKGPNGWPEIDERFIFGNSQYEGYIAALARETGEEIPLQNLLCIPIGFAFDLMVIVEVWKIRSYKMVNTDDIPDWEKTVEHTGSDVYHLEGTNGTYRKRWSPSDMPGFYRRLGLQARIVKPMPPQMPRQVAEQEGGA